MVQSKHFKRTERGYSRCHEKVITQSAVEFEYFDPLISDQDVVAGDTGIAQLMQVDSAETLIGPPIPGSPFEQLRERI